MLGNTFNNMNLMNQALDGYSKRNESINNNISNVNTPGYKKTKILFEENLKSQINKNDNLKLKTTNNKHIKDVGGTNMVIENKHFSTRRDGNNVNIDVEMAVLAKNTMMYNAVIRQVSNESRKIRSIIKEGN
ncbi:MAG: flagellar basal body rod protein FlgB [Senegalia sp. (in: firmicutes)]|uniref:flagellar basal body rod protein FlgB n=1 Tax=Senegalia sp. (in: firmicutes) TaxID=1924098 RepID=UPI003F96DA36